MPSLYRSQVYVFSQVAVANNVYELIMDSSATKPMACQRLSLSSTWHSKLEMVLGRV